MCLGLIYILKQKLNMSLFFDIENPFQRTWLIGYKLTCLTYWFHDILSFGEVPFGEELPYLFV